MVARSNKMSGGLMATQSRYAELARHITALGAVKRALTRGLPAECPGGPAAVLSLLQTNGEMRMSRLSELLAVDMSVTSRHVAHLAQRGWLERLPDPADGRSRILRLTPGGRGMLVELGERTVDAVARTLADWSDDDLVALSAMLDRLRTDFGDCRGRPGDLGSHPSRDLGHRLAHAYADERPSTGESARVGAMDRAQGDGSRTPAPS
jgi:DNA-binding MarR family transcriptional regulator